jgi:hypothetical protein
VRAPLVDVIGQAAAASVALAAFEQALQVQGGLSEFPFRDLASVRAAGGSPRTASSREVARPSGVASDDRSALMGSAPPPDSNRFCRFAGGLPTSAAAT